jgi:hypothetical protein
MASTINWRRRYNNSICWCYIQRIHIVHIYKDASNKRCIHITKSSTFTLTAPTFYLTVMAALDVLICLLYLLIMSIDAFVLYFKIEFLWIVWHYYVVELYTLSRMTQLASTYVIVFASLERLIMASARLQHHRM